jgi:energy-coupling factor transporter ATP-binding protein EcfA2
MEPLSAVVTAALSAVAKDFVKGIVKKTAAGLKDLFKEDESVAILNKAFSDFKESCFKETGDTDEKKLLAAFEAFFRDDRTAIEFALVFDAKSKKVDFNLLEEIFFGYCIEQEIEVPSFEFFQTLSHVIKGIEELAQTKEAFQAAFHTKHLQGIYNQLKPRGEETNPTFARFKYLKQLILHNSRLQFTGIPHPQEKKDIQLPSIFVMQRARESVPEKDYRRLIEEMKHDDSFSGEEIELRKMMPVYREEKQQPVKFDSAFEQNENRRFVVLGKPGSGKSSLLKFFMLKIASKHLEFHRDSEKLPFPILVEIRKFENALAKTNKTDYNILDFLYDSMSRNYGLRLPKGFFEAYLDSGRALLMFDGLDEVAAESRRAEIRSMISAFITGRHPANRVIITSRIAGYSRAQFSTTDYRHFTLEDFNDDEIEEFIERWYRSRLTNRAKADEDAKNLKEALWKKPRIKELAQNPLLLTIIAIIHRYEADLPEDRLVLYDKATEALLYTWDNIKDIIDEKFKLSHRRRFLGQVAFHLQSIEKGDEAGTMIDRHDLYAILLEDFCKAFNCENWEAQGLVDKFLETIRQRAGLIVELAPGKFGFAHKTFQEYFAAQWIANEATLNYDLGIMIDYVDKFIDNAFWHETLLLALRALPAKQALKVLEHILKRDPKGIEPHLYHNHYFVMKFLAEQGQWLDNKEFVELQTDDFFEFSWNRGKDRGFYKNYTWQRLKEWVSTVSDTLALSFLHKKLLSMVEDTTLDGGLRCDSAEALGKLGQNEKAVDFLLAMAEDKTLDGELRRCSAEALAKLGQIEIAVDFLLAMAEDRALGSTLRSSCAYTVGNLGQKEKTVVERLLAMAGDKTLRDSLRQACAVAVGNLGQKEKTVIEQLLIMAEDKTLNGYLRRDCSKALGKLGQKEIALDFLLAMAEDKTMDIYLRSSCVEAVGNLGQKEKSVLERLLAMAEDKTVDSYLRRYCIYTLGKLGQNEKTVVGRLMSMAEDKTMDGFFRRDCAESVGNLGQKEKAVEILLTMAEDKTMGSYLRSDCALVVGKLGQKDKAVDILVELYLAQLDKNSDDARRIYDSLWEVTEV